MILCCLDEKEASFTQKLVTKIIDNLQVEIKNVHICLEDFSTNPKVNQME